MPWNKLMTIKIRNVRSEGCGWAIGEGIVLVLLDLPFSFNIFRVSPPEDMEYAVIEDTDKRNETYLVSINAQEEMSYLSIISRVAWNSARFAAVPGSLWSCEASGSLAHGFRTTLPSDDDNR